MAGAMPEPQSFDRVVSSMCTRPHPAAREAAERFLATNPGDPETYRSVAAVETGVVETLGEMTGLDDPHGYVASGGTEANIQAVRAARNRADALAARGFEVVDPVLPLVAVDLPEALFDALTERGWRLARTARDELRPVCMPHVTRETLDAFLRDLDDCRGDPATGT
jgi:glutamate/tyrosine decarboxylase-like PLP-dependent enzyme